MDYRSYRFTDRSPHYDDDVARHITKMASGLETEPRSQMFDVSVPITTLIFFHASQRRVTGMAFMRVLQCDYSTFLKKPTGAICSALECYTSSHPSRQKEKLTCHCQAVNYVLNTYATDDIIAELYVKFISYKQPKDLSAVDHSHALRQKPYDITLHTTSTDLNELS